MSLQASRISLKPFGELDIKSKNKYRKLKLSVLLQTVFVTALTVLVGAFLLNYVIDGIYNESLGRIFVDILMSMGVKRKPQ